MRLAPSALQVPSRTCLRSSRSLRNSTAHAIRDTYDNQGSDPYAPQSADPYAAPCKGPKRFHAGSDVRERLSVGDGESGFVAGEPRTRANISRYSKVDGATDDFGGSGRRAGGGFKWIRKVDTGPEKNSNVRTDSGSVPQQSGSPVCIKTSFYDEHPDIIAMSEERSEALLSELDATVQGRQPHPRPVMTFELTSFPSDLLVPLTSAGFLRPTPIQAVGWPAVMSGRDVVGIAPTGGGKTLAYLLPALAHVAAREELQPGSGPPALIVAPTRELVMQIDAEVRKFATALGISSVAVVGGSSRYAQASTLRRGVGVVVATPGRLLDFLDSGVVSLANVGFFCLDEADRMFDMGFEHQIRNILSQTPSNRQTVMWSATWPSEIQSLVLDICGDDCVRLTIGREDVAINPDIVQQVEVLDDRAKRNRAISFLKERCSFGDRTLVFCETKGKCNELARELQYHQLPAAAMHADKDQRVRDRVMADFKSGRTLIVVASDVAQRGLDVKDVRYVVNYDVPRSIEDYIHRIGRTGRAGADGTAVTFFPAQPVSTDGVSLAQDICTIMRSVGQRPPAELLRLSRVR